MPKPSREDDVESPEIADMLQVGHAGNAHMSHMKMPPFLQSV